jgi:phage-related holin
MNNAILFIIIMIIVLTLDNFSREGIQLPENLIKQAMDLMARTLRR